MKFLHFLIFFFLFSLQSFAQQNHFIYIQTENKQPFYVRVGDRLLSSSSAGYIVIPKLQDGKYDLNIGFPKNEWPQQKMNVTVNNNDAGFVLKNFDSKGWGLFNMQTMEVVMSVSNQAKKDSATTGQADGFADVLADVVNTPSIKQKQVVPASGEVKETVDPKPVPVEEKVSAVAIKEEKKVADIIKPAVKISSTLDNTGRSVVYADSYENNIDTIRIFIPYNTVEKEVKDTIVQPVEKLQKEDPKPAVKEEPKEDKKFINIELPNPNTKKDSAVSEINTEKKEIPASNKELTEPKPVNTTTAMINSDCKSVASEDDFLKLRKKMAAQKTDENMIVMAKKAFVSKCYTTDQVNNLSALFLKDEGRYNFFDAAYPHVSDTQKFGSLMGRLSDEYYINRFKAMIRH